MSSILWESTDWSETLVGTCRIDWTMRIVMANIGYRNTLPAIREICERLLLFICGFPPQV